jgi:quercetin dioxygenase-like cupin family protein
MNRHVPLRAVGAVVAATSIAIAVPPLVAWSQSARPSQSRVALTQQLPSLDGAKLAATLVEVTYHPGGANPSHRHPCPVIGYVLEGHMRMQIDGQPARVYGPGDTFYESPADVHRVSANASDEHPARFLAYFVCDHNTPLSISVPDKPHHDATGLAID